MCSVAIALTAMTTGLQMAGQYQSSRAEAAAANAQADAAYQNAKIQNRKGEQIAEQYAQQQREADAKRKLVLGQQRAEASASGLSGGVGSSLDMYMATMNAWNEDSQNLLTNQRYAMFDNNTATKNYIAQGDAYRAQAKAAKQAGNIAMAGTLLSGAASLYGMKGAGGSSGSTTSTATAQTPNAAGWRATGLDSAFSGVQGYTPLTTGSVQGAFGTYGPKVMARNTYYSMSGWNGRL